MAKVSKTKINAIIKNNNKPVETVELNIGDSTVAVEIDPNISHANFIAAARELAEMQFAVNNGTGEEVYAPYLAEFAEWYVLLKYYTNIDTSISKNESDPEAKAFERLWALRYCGDLKEKIYDVVDWIALTNAAVEIVNDRKEQLRLGAAKFWTNLNELLDEMKQQLYQYSEDDMSDLLAGIRKLSGMDEGKIIQFLKDAKTETKQ